MASQLVEGRGTSLQSPASALSNLQARAVHFLSNIRRQEEDKCKVSPNLCEKPAVSAQTTTWVVVGVVLYVFQTPLTEGASIVPQLTCVIRPEVYWLLVLCPSCCSSTSRRRSVRSKRTGRISSRCPTTVLTTTDPCPPRGQGKPRHSQGFRSTISPDPDLHLVATLSLTMPDPRGPMRPIPAGRRGATRTRAFKPTLHRKRNNNEAPGTGYGTRVTTEREDVS